jgi:hypothetical protein
MAIYEKKNAQANIATKSGGGVPKTAKMLKKAALIGAVTSGIGKSTGTAKKKPNIAKKSSAGAITSRPRAVTKNKIY